MLSVIMFILKFLWSRFHLRIDQFTTGCHLGNLLQHNSIVNCLMGILSPGKRSMILTQNRRNSLIISVLKVICDENACIFLIDLLNFLFIQITNTGNLPVNVIRMGSSITGNRPSSLCPACCSGGMCMYNSSNLRKCIIKNYMCWSI